MCNTIHIKKYILLFNKVHWLNKNNAKTATNINPKCDLEDLKLWNPKDGPSGLQNLNSGNFSEMPYLYDIKTDKLRWILFIKF
jgi:hypothetical protein